MRDRLNVYVHLMPGNSEGTKLLERPLPRKSLNAAIESACTLHLFRWPAWSLIPPPLLHSFSPQNAFFFTRSTLTPPPHNPASNPTLPSSGRLHNATPPPISVGSRGGNTC